MTGLHAALPQALETSLTAPGVTASLSDLRSRDWASGTFEGARHQLTLRLDGPDARAAASRFLRGLDDWEVLMRGQFLADLIFLAEERWDDGTICLHVEALTIRADPPLPAA